MQRPGALSSCVDTVSIRAFVVCLGLSTVAPSKIKLEECLCLFSGGGANTNSQTARSPRRETIFHCHNGSLTDTSLACLISVWACIISLGNLYPTTGMRYSLLKLNSYIPLLVEHLWAVSKFVFFW